MGQKVHPYGFRLGYIKNWRSRWFSKAKNFASLLNEDIKIRNYIKKQYYSAAISSIEIERASDRVRIIINSARPGIIIGRRGQDIDRLREDLSKMTDKDVYIDIKEIKDPQTDAQLIAENIAFQMERRVGFRRSMKKSVQMAMEHGAEGVKIRCSGRLDGIELARSEVYKEGKVPLQTLRADIDYGFAESLTAYGLIGVKVWLYKGEVLPDKKRKADDAKQKTDDRGRKTEDKAQKTEKAEKKE